VVSLLEETHQNSLPSPPLPVVTPIIYTLLADPLFFGKAKPKGKGKFPVL